MADNVDHVQVEIDIANAGIPRDGFGMPLVLSHNAPFPGRIAFYSDASEAVDAGYSRTSPEVRALTTIFSQQPKPAVAAVGKALNAPTQRYLLSVTDVRNEDSYQLNVQGEDFADALVEYESDSSASLAEIHNGLLTELNAVPDKNFVATFVAKVVADFAFTADNTTETFAKVGHGLKTGDGPLELQNSGGALPTGVAPATPYYSIRLTDDTFQLASSRANAFAGTVVAITTNGTGVHTLSDTVDTVSPNDGIVITGTAPANYFSIEVLDVGAMNIKQTHADPGVAADLDAILLADGSWYELHTNFNSKAYALACAAWIAQHQRIYVFDTNDTDVITKVLAGAQDVLAAMLALGYSMVAGAYHPRPAAMFSAAWMGRWLPTLPGATNPKFRTLQGVETTKFTTTHKANLKARRGNGYETVFGRPITWEGTVFSTVYKFLDVRRNVDWMTDDMTKNIFGKLADAEIVGFDDPGIQVISGGARESLELAEDRKVIADKPKYVVQLPEATGIPSQDKSDRVLRKVKFSAELVGAINTVIPVLGSISF